MVRVSLRTVTMQIPSQKIITKDNVSIDIAAVAYYHISDPEKAVIVIENVYNAIKRTIQPRSASFGHRKHQRADQERHRPAHGAVGHAGDGGRNQRHCTSRQYAARHGKGSRGRARASREDRRCRRGIPSRNEAGPSGRHHHGASRGTSAPHSPDDGGNLGRKELNHHLPCTIYDDGAGSYRALVKEQHLNSLEKGCSCKFSCKSVSKMRNRQRPSAQQLDMRWSGWRNTNTALPGVVLPSSRRVRSTATVPSIVSTSG